MGRGWRRIEPDSAPRQSLTRQLDFKRDKSTTGLDKLPNRLPSTIETWIYAKLIVNQLLRKLADAGSAIPPSAIATTIGPNVHDAA